MSCLRRVLLILFVLSVGHDRLMAYENNNEGEEEETCDQELAHITVVNSGNNCYVFCLETDENNRIKSFRYNTYDKDTHEFIESKVYDEEDLGVSSCTYPHSGETNETFLANQDTQLPLSSAPRAELSRRVLGIKDNGTNSDNCISNQTVNIGSKYGFRALYLQTSYFNFYQGGDLYFTYLSSFLDKSYETLGLRLSRHNDEWILSDIDNQRVRALEVEMYKSLFLFGIIPLGIKSIRPIYAEEDMMYEEDNLGSKVNMVENH